MPHYVYPLSETIGQQEVAAVGESPQPLDQDDLEAAANCERSRQASFRSLRSSQSSFCSFKSVGRFSRWGSFKSFKSGVSLASFMSAKWDVTDPPAGGREVAWGSGCRHG